MQDAGFFFKGAIIVRVYAEGMNQWRRHDQQEKRRDNRRWSTPQLQLLMQLHINCMWSALLQPSSTGKKNEKQKGQNLVHNHRVSGRTSLLIQAFCFQSLCIQLLCCTSATLGSNQFPYIDYFVPRSHQPRLNGEKKSETPDFCLSAHRTLRNITFCPQRQPGEKCCCCSLSETHEVRVSAKTGCFQNVSHLQKCTRSILQHVGNKIHSLGSFPNQEFN